MAGKRKQRTVTVYAGVVAPKRRLNVEPGIAPGGLEAGTPEHEETAEFLAQMRWWRVRVVEGEPFPFELWVRIGRLSDGRFACTGLKLNPGSFESEITARALREINFTEIVSAAVRSAHAHDPAFSRHLLGYEIPELPERSQPRLRPGPPGYDDDFFREVADLYKEALREDPSHPYRHFRAQWGTAQPSLSTARRWVQRARDKGFLGAATPGKAGEQPRTS